MGANALIIGTGGVGSVIGQKLHGYAAFDRIFLGDVDTTYAQRLHERTPKSRFEVVSINAMDSAALATFIAEKKDRHRDECGHVAGESQRARSLR